MYEKYRIYAIRLQKRISRLMKLPRWGTLFWAICCIGLLIIPSGYAGESIPVFVSILPQKYFVEQIAGDLADVSVMVQPGASPATYEPRPKQMALLSTARIYFAIGVPFENVWLPKIQTSNPDMRIILTDKGIKKIPMKTMDHTGHGAGLEREHGMNHGMGLDPHVWTSPEMVKIIAGNIHRAFIEMDDRNEQVYEKNYRRFIREIDELDQSLKDLFAAKGKKKSFMVFHPSWGYFASNYGLEQIPVEIEGKNPKPAQLQHLITTAREKGINVIFVQPQFSAQSAKVVADALGGSVVFADPLAYDWAKNLRQQANAFRSAVK